MTISLPLFPLDADIPGAMVLHAYHTTMYPVSTIIHRYRQFSTKIRIANSHSHCHCQHLSTISNKHSSFFTTSHNPYSPALFQGVAAMHRNLRSAVATKAKCSPEFAAHFTAVTFAENGSTPGSVTHLAALNILASNQIFCASMLVVLFRNKVQRVYPFMIIYA